MQEVKGNSEEEGEEFVATATGEDESSSRLHSNESNQTRREGKQQLELRLGGREGGREEELGQEAVPVVMVEKEHMFEKVVTPSDVGKLNRLVIPKQHAEKYFPLDSSSNEKGLLLNFEDRSGKLWRFRYSYWNSSQSYVMTKGWSRFVKDKKLDAGDVVSFHRGVGELYRHRLYIDWRPRSSHHPLNSSIFTLPYFLPTTHYNHNNYRAINARTPLYTSNPHPYSPPYPHPRHHHFHQHPIYNNNNNNNNYYTLHQHQQYLHPPPPPQPDHNYYLTSPIPQQQQQEADRMIIDSVPIAHHHHTLITAPAAATASTPTTPGKRMRLFGVNMECASSPASSTATHVPLPLPSSTPRFGDPRGENLTSQYPHSSAQ